MNRKYNCSDSVLINFGEATLVNLDVDLPGFTALDPAKVVGLRSAIDANLGIRNSERLKAKMKQFTEAVNREMKVCQDAFLRIWYFVRKMFKEESAILRQFVFNEYRKIRQKQGKMVTFFADLEKTATQYKDQLVAKGTPEDLVNSIGTIGTTLGKANAEQDAFINQQPVKTAERVKVFNQLYDLLLEFSDAAEIVYNDQPEKRSLYSLPYNDSPSDEEV